MFSVYLSMCSFRHTTQNATPWLAVADHLVFTSMHSDRSLDFYSVRLFVCDAFADVLQFKHEHFLSLFAFLFYHSVRDSYLRSANRLVSHSPGSPLGRVCFRLCTDVRGEAGATVNHHKVARQMKTEEKGMLWEPTFPFSSPALSSSQGWFLIRLF